MQHKENDGDPQPIKNKVQEDESNESLMSLCPPPPADPSDWSTDKPTSVSAADVEDKAAVPGEEEEHEDLDTSSSQPPSQPPHNEPSAPSASSEREEEEEPSWSPAPPPSHEGEGGV